MDKPIALSVVHWNQRNKFVSVEKSKFVYYENTIEALNSKSVDEYIDYINSKGYKKDNTGRFTRDDRKDYYSIEADEVYIKEAK